MIPIVVVAFNRAKSLQRILGFIDKGLYPAKNIPLIISIDRGDNQDVIDVANRFEWKFGEKQVLCHEQNLGLRAHIIQCASLSEKYGGVIILEDDLLVSPNFYNYTLAALEFSKGKDKIGGISLYNHQINVHNSDPFWPMEDGYDNWYFQFASSWGEAWSREQWNKFIAWYKENKDKDLHADNFPEYVAAWSAKSWLKYYIKYLIETDRYFLYPRISLSSNCSEKGEHAIGADNTAFQVPMLCCEKKEYRFSELQESQAVYDAFYENTKLTDYIPYSSLTIDLYGYRKTYNTRYVLTSRALNYKIVEGFACSMRPHEANVLMHQPGNDFLLYDTQEIAVNNLDEKHRLSRRNRYKFKIAKREQVFQMTKEQLEQDAKKILDRLKK